MLPWLRLRLHCREPDNNSSAAVDLSPLSGDPDTSVDKAAGEGVSGASRRARNGDLIDSSKDLTYKTENAACSKDLKLRQQLDWLSTDNVTSITSRPPRRHVITGALNLSRDNGYDLTVH